MDYELMIPPAHLAQPFEEFSKEQVEEYFQWFMTQIEHRIQILSRYIEEEGEIAKFDYSPESLVPL